MKLTTTLTKIRSCSPCQSGWRTLLKYLGEDFDPDAEINLLTILESNGVADMLWTLRATDQDSKQISSQLAIEFAELALPIFEKRYPDDTRPRLCIQAAHDYNEGKISREELQKARNAAYAADAYAADAYAAAYAADAAARGEMQAKQAGIIRMVLEA